MARSVLCTIMLILGVFLTYAASTVNSEEKPQHKSETIGTVKFSEDELIFISEKVDTSSRVCSKQHKNLR